jgi:hypothetical protein
MKGSARAGFAMVLVMILVAVGLIVGMSCLAAASLRVSISHNLQSLSRARYLAESGLEHGIYLLRESPRQLDGSQTSPLGPFYVDGTGDSYTFYAVRDPQDARRYLLTSEGSAGGHTRASSVVVQTTPQPPRQTPHAVQLTGTSVTLPAGVTVTGDVHVNGDLMSYGQVVGDVSATGTVGGDLSKISGQVTEGVDAVESPQLDTQTWMSYMIDGVVYQPVELTASQFTDANLPIDGAAITPDNPGGVVWLRPLEAGQPVRISADRVTGFTFQGTILVEGDLEINGDRYNLAVTPVAGFPALVMTGTVSKIKIAGDRNTITFNGLVIADTVGLQGDRNDITINGGLVASSISHQGNFSSLQVNYDPERSTIAHFIDQAWGPQGNAGARIIVWKD